MTSHRTSRRRFLRQSLAASTAVIACQPGWLGAVEPDGGVIDIGSRRELLMDDFLFNKLVGAELKLHKPEAREVVLTCDAPWEGNVSAYYTMFEDDGLFRAYYRAWHYDPKAKKPLHPAYTCYAESRDGLTWVKPELGLVEVNGSKANNIIQADPDAAQNFVPFKDNNPACAANARYKALAGGFTMLNGKKKACLHAYQSTDGIHWSRMAEAVITAGAFDSQNLAFWDAERGEYRAYWRIFSNKLRAIRTATSKDFIHWDHQADLTYGDTPPVHLYTNAIRPYFRAPHLLIGFPTHYLATPKEQVEPDFMSSRDAVKFRRWEEAVIPTTAPQDRDGNRSNYMANGLVQLPGQDKELSVYATEAYYKGPASRVRRFVYRMDGFVSANAGAAGGMLTSRPVTFAGSKLSFNLVSKGGTRVELQDANGKPLPGFALEDCTPVTGDFIDHTVSWKGGDLASLAGKPVRLCFELKDADLYAFQFK